MSEWLNVCEGGGAHLICIKIKSNIFTEVCCSAVMRRVSHTYDLCLVAVLLLAATHKLLHLLCVCITKQTLLWNLPTALCAAAAWQHLQKARFDLIWTKVSARVRCVCRVPAARICEAFALSSEFLSKQRSLQRSRQTLHNHSQVRDS